MRPKLEDMTERIVRHILDGAYVNLGIGKPTRVANYVSTDKDVIYHSEKGIIGVGPALPEGEEEPDLINAGKQYVTLLPNGCYFDNFESFAMMRGGYGDTAVLGAFLRSSTSATSR